MSKKEKKGKKKKEPVVDDGPLELKSDRPVLPNYEDIMNEVNGGIIMNEVNNVKVEKEDDVKGLMIDIKVVSEVAPEIEVGEKKEKDEMIERPVDSIDLYNRVNKYYEGQKVSKREKKMKEEERVKRFIEWRRNNYIEYMSKHFNNSFKHMYGPEGHFRKNFHKPEFWKQGRVPSYFKQQTYVLQKYEIKDTEFINGYLFYYNEMISILVKKLKDIFYDDYDDMKNYKFDHYFHTKITTLERTNDRDSFGARDSIDKAHKEYCIHCKNKPRSKSMRTHPNCRIIIEITLSIYTILRT